MFSDDFPFLIAGNVNGFQIAANHYTIGIENVFLVASQYVAECGIPVLRGC